MTCAIATCGSRKSCSTGPTPTFPRRIEGYEYRLHRFGGTERIRSLTPHGLDFPAHLLAHLRFNVDSRLHRVQRPGEADADDGQTTREIASALARCQLRVHHDW